MSPIPAYPWRSALSRRLFSTQTDGREQAAFGRLLAAHTIGEAALRALVRFWVLGRRPGESFVSFLARTDRMTAEASWCVYGPTTDPEAARGAPILTSDALASAGERSGFRERVVGLLHGFPNPFDRSRVTDPAV